MAKIKKQKMRIRDAYNHEKEGFAFLTWRDCDYCATRKHYNAICKRLGVIEGSYLQYLEYGKWYTLCCK